MGTGKVGGGVPVEGPERLVTRWRGEGAPDEERLRGALRDEGLSPTTFSMAPGETYAFHEHDHDEVRWVVHGSVRFGLEGGSALVLGPGDRLDLPARTRHDARTLGRSTCTMVSAERRA